ncbi:MAG: hypothetical protein LBC48_02005 [Dysgonamonadaceae bacterium]|nr:hypothetical protein [Dysgonamonadaceae bacterium]
MKKVYMNRFAGKIAIECKFKILKRPISLAGFNRFCDEESIPERYIINRNYNTTFNQAKLLQGFLTSKIGLVQGGNKK